ncbi:MAG TPA: hypothetical protein DD727_01345 [Clostridiales bacterium]|nr:hypothetical protein [Clostridiales bacterium]
MRMKQLLASVMLLVVLASGITTVAAQPPYKSYTYTLRDFDAPSPVPYMPVQIIDKNILGVELKEPQDFVYDAEGNFYILTLGSTTQGSASIVITDKNWKVTKVINTFKNNGKDDYFKKPTGLFVTQDKRIFVCDTDNKRVVVIDMDANLLQIIEKPQVEFFYSDYEFTPRKVAVGNTGSIYLVVKNDYNGIMEMDANGTFMGYIGSNRVAANPLELFWKSIFSQKQRDQMIQYVPIEYGNIHMEKNGFMFVVSPSETVAQPVRRLNAGGRDILIRKGYTGTVSGDRVTTNKSIFVDVTVDDWGIYSVLDQRRGRIFSFSSEGDLLYIFGNSANQVGTFKTPVAIDTKDEKLYVLDSGNENLSIFEMTDYARLIKTANKAYYDGEYDLSSQIWNQVLRINANFELAYVQIGRVLLRKEQFKEAMEYFELGNYRGSATSRDNGYTKAMTEYRKDYLRDNFGIFASSLLAAVALLWLLRFLKRRKTAVKTDENWEGDSA